MNHLFFQNFQNGIPQKLTIKIIIRMEITIIVQLEEIIEDSITEQKLPILEIIITIWFRHLTLITLTNYNNNNNLINNYLF